MNLHYEARTEYPEAADVERVAHEVVNEFTAITSERTPELAGQIAREIKRRLSAMITVEVDLTVTVTTKVRGNTPPVAIAHGSTLSTVDLLPCIPDRLRLPNFFGSFPGPI